MAYIDAEGVRKIRNNLKARFPRKDGWKFSVRKDGHIAVDITILESPVHLYVYKVTDNEFRMPFPESDPIALMTDTQINQYHFRKLHPVETANILAEILAIITENHWDKSDIMTDYFHCAFYYHLSVGKWDKPCVYV